MALSKLVGVKEHGFWDIFAVMISCSVIILPGYYGLLGGWNRLYSRRFLFRQTAIEFFVGWIFSCIVLRESSTSCNTALQLSTQRLLDRRTALIRLTRARLGFIEGRSKLIFGCHPWMSCCWSSLPSLRLEQVEKIC